MKLFARRVASKSRRSGKKRKRAARAQAPAGRRLPRARLRTRHLLRHLGADLRPEEGRRDAGAKHRLRRRRQDLQPTRGREPARRSAERSLAVFHRCARRARGHAFLQTRRARSSRRVARRLPRHYGRLGQRRREHDHPAARAQQSAARRPHAPTEDARGDGRVADRAAIHQGADPRALREPDLFRLRLLRDRDRLAGLLRQERLETESLRSRDARRADPQPEPILALEESGRRGGATKHRARSHARAEKDHRRAGRSRRRTRA